MFMKTVLFLVVCFFAFNCEARKKRLKNETLLEDTTKYPMLFRDHVYYKLSEKGKDMFYATNIHPLCAAKKGQCIQRARCYGREMLYISRICYHWDLVCCYDNTIKFPEVAHKSYTPPVTENFTTTEVYIEPEVLP